LVPCPVAGDRRGCQRAIGQRPLDTALHRLMMTPSLWPTAQNEGFSRYASSICARDTRLASSSLDRESVVKAAISSSLIANSTARRHPAMIQLLISPTANEESINNPSVPPIQPAPRTQVSRNRSSSRPGGKGDLKASGAVADGLRVGDRKFQSSVHGAISAAAVAGALE
jgi:hypothetical protein